MSFTSQQFRSSRRNAYTKNKAEKDLDKFAQDLTVAVNRCLPTLTKTYEQVAVLMFHWENDDLRVLNLEDQLSDVFSKEYNYVVERYVIPAIRNPSKALQNRMLAFRAVWDTEDALTIYVYSGHSAQSKPPDFDTFYIAGSLSPRGYNLTQSQIEWIQLQPLLTSPDGDTLIIFDSCFAGNAARQIGPEFLGAAGSDTFAAGDIYNCFTHTLIAELKKRAGNSALVCEIFGSIYRGATDRDLPLPIWVPHKNKPCICLAPLPKGKGKAKSVSYSQRIERLRQQPRPAHKIVISVHLADQHHDPSPKEWEKWLTTCLPSNIYSTEISVEADFRSSLKMLLVSLPVEVWSMLPADDPTYDFVGVVKSRNHLLER